MPYSVVNGQGRNYHEETPHRPAGGDLKPTK